MTTGNPTDTSLDDAIRRFTDAEAALRALLQSAGEMSRASAKVDAAASAVEAARGDAAIRVENAISAIDAAGRAAAERMHEAVVVLVAAAKDVKDTASAVCGLTAELKDVAKELKDTAVAFRGLEPERIAADLDQIRERQRRDGVLTATTLGVAFIAAVAAIISILV